MARLIDGVVGHADQWAKLERARLGGSLPHALCFAGPPGVGKRLVARAFAQSLLCEKIEAAPCGVCGACRRVETHQSESMLEIAPEKNQIKLEAAHAILEFLSLRRLGSARVVIIDGAERMNPQTANAGLKVLEEPPPETYFVLITPEASQLLPTLRSRSQVVRFGPLPAQDLARAAGSPAEPWMIEASAGRLDRLAGFANAETGAVREDALEVLRHTLAGSRAGIAKAIAGAKDRERTLLLIQFLQRHLRDWVTGRLELEAPRDPRGRVELWRAAFGMENDFLAHVDRSLLFENFFIAARSAAST